MANWWDQYGSLTDFFNTTPASRTATATSAGNEYADPFGSVTPGYQTMFDQGYTLAQDPAQFGNYKVGNFQTNPSQQVFDPKTGALFYPGESIGGSWEKRYDTGGPIGAFDLGMIIAALGSAGALAYGGAGAAAAGGAETGAGAVGADAGLGAAGGVGGGAGAAGVTDPLGAYLIEAGALPTGSPYGAAVLSGTPNWAIPGVSGAGGALGYLGGSAAAVNDSLGAWLIEHGYEMDPTYAGQVTAGTPNWSVPGVSGAGGSQGYEGSTPSKSLWDKLLDKKPPTPPSGLGGQGGLLEGNGNGGDGGEGGSIWSDYVNPMSFNPVQGPQFQKPGTFSTPYGFENELQKRLALIRGAK